ncbi:1,2-phenylacetyl-CoA epoxidase subunit PaaE [Undibacterium sp.]|jgi:ring-1,2-phenylacetyl-CoA epoxidase subunit PaaE|uniref:1,2-phenylacetyl-CoA epoxidase subunit PaaE n=1 Tax=Undibacterium sp. TaxID=1914977 RepID=UPI002B96F092|nr:1,2-phenylacetyl-CoA epoxidase subunit PaaE [Undibacterium sp.]HTD04959.1 1,2-phenylacetyl-CoA epoxidase subunit PaaE [Undibacterium sp.]
MTPHFHTLSIREARQETRDAISLSFKVPAELQDSYRYIQGQFLTLRAQLDGQEVRRAYSICSSVDEYRRLGILRVAIKRVGDGLFSQFAQKLNAGDLLEVMPPDGRFFTELNPQQARHYVAFAAGSGITPVLSIIKTTLASEPLSRFTLIFGNRNVDSILFCEELEDLKDQYLDRFILHHILSRAPNEIELHHGRIDAKKMAALLQLMPAAGIDHAFICGPNDMIDCVESSLLAAGVPRRQIHTERFGTPVAKSAPTAGETTPAADAGTVALTVILDGKRHGLRLPRQGASVLDVALQAGLDLPYACKGGVCCTCRAKLMDGKVVMEKNYTLEEWEVAQGFVLTCQSHPRSDNITVSFDER